MNVHVATEKLAIPEPTQVRNYRFISLIFFTLIFRSTRRLPKGRDLPLGRMLLPLTPPPHLKA